MRNRVKISVAAVLQAFFSTRPRAKQGFFSWYETCPEQIDSQSIGRGARREIICDWNHAEGG
jgi:hypothetical protein